MPDISLPVGLGGHLQRWRACDHLRQRDIALASGLSVPTVRLLERDRGLVRSYHQVLDAFGLTIAGRVLPQAPLIGQAIAILRKRRCISQRELAAMLDCCQDTIIALERSQGNLSTLNRALLMLGAGAYLAKRSDVKSFYTHAGNSSGQNLWTTPVWLIEALVGVLGRFDLDPCAATQRPVTRAKVVFTPDDDGLTLPWYGTVFINPPYGRELGAWIGKIITEVEAQRVSCVVALVPARTDTNWWHRALWSGASVLYLKGRLKFGGVEQSAPFPSALLFWGVLTDQFSALRSAFPDAIAVRV